MCFYGERSTRRNIIIIIIIYIYIHVLMREEKEHVVRSTSLVKSIHVLCHIEQEIMYHKKFISPAKPDFAGLRNSCYHIQWPTVAT